MRISDRSDQSSFSESPLNNGGRGFEGKKSYIIGLIVIFACVYSQYLGFHFGPIFGVLIVYGIPILVITLLWGTTIIKRSFSKTFSALKLGLGFFGGFTVLGILVSVAILYFLTIYDPAAVNLLDRPNPVLNVSPEFAWVMVGVSILVVGPAEEYIFRGFMFGGLLGIFRNRHWVTLAFFSSLMFAAVHLYYAVVYGIASLIQFTDLVTFGMAMAATYYLSSGNLFVPSLIHGVYDATAFVGVATSMDVGVRLRGFMLLVGIVAGFLLLVQRGRRKDKSSHNVPSQAVEGSTALIKQA